MVYCRRKTCPNVLEIYFKLLENFSDLKFGDNDNNNRVHAIYPTKISSGFVIKSFLFSNFPNKFLSGFTKSEFNEVKLN